MSLALTRKSRKFFWASVSNERSIFEGFSTTFCSSEDRKVLMNDTIELWKAGIIGGYKDRSVSVFL